MPNPTTGTDEILTPTSRWPVEIGLGTLAADNGRCLHRRVGVLPTAGARWLGVARLSGCPLGLGHEDEPPDTGLIQP